MYDLGNKDVFAKNLKYYMDLHKIDRNQLCAALNFKYTTVSEWLAGNKYPRIDKIELLANYFEIQKSDLIENKDFNKTFENSGVFQFKQDIVSPFMAFKEELVTFPVIGEVAAGYDYPAIEDWEGETVEIPSSYLKGRNRDDFFVLKVKGDSMYPIYHEGDKVLVLRQTTLNYSGQVGVILYDDELASLKKVEYKMGEDWLRMVPINPTHQAVKIDGERLEHCRILGIPKLLLRDIED